MPIPRPRTCTTPSARTRLVAGVIGRDDDPPGLGLDDVVPPYAVLLDVHVERIARIGCVKPAK